MNSDSPLAWVAIDFLSALLLVVYTLVAPPSKPASIDTLGQYAIETTWPASRADDVDTFVQDPTGKIAWYFEPDVGLMHLEHDDLGKRSDTEQGGGKVAVVNDNRERVILRGTLPGEMTVNVDAYRKVGNGGLPVTIKLYRLRGDDDELLVRHLTLHAQSEEATAFRFTLDANGKLMSHNELSKRLAAAAMGAPT
jgi:hypothetical protein